MKMLKNFKRLILEFIMFMRMLKNFKETNIRTDYVHENT